MALYDVLIKQEFTGYKVIEAESKDQAEIMAWELIQKGLIDPITNFDSTIDITDIEELEE